MNCPYCDWILSQESTACAEIYGVCHQTCWLECTNCGYETDSIEWIEGQPPIWPELYKLAKAKQGYTKPGRQI